jgi:hypothetical protein
MNKTSGSRPIQIANYRDHTGEPRKRQWSTGTNPRSWGVGTRGAMPNDFRHLARAIMQKGRGFVYAKVTGRRMYVVPLS